MDVVVVGLGSMGKRRIRLLKRFPQVGKIIGIDQRGDRRSETEASFDCITYSDIDTALKENPECACAFLCTSPLSHNNLTSEMLNHNLHVFSEINLVSDGYEKNMRLAKQKGRILFLSSTFCYRDEICYIRRQIASEKPLNYIYHVGQYLPDWHPWENYKDFFVGNTRTNACREIMAIELPWLLDIFGKVRKYHVISDKMSHLQIEYNDNYMLQLEHESGHKGALIIDIVSPKAVRNLEIYGENTYYSWNGSPDGLEEWDAATQRTKQVCLYEKAEHIDGYRSFVVENAYQNEIHTFFDTIEGKAEPRYGFKEDLEILTLIDQIEGVTQ